MLELTREARQDIKPTRDEVYAHFAKGDHVPIYRTLLADLETPCIRLYETERGG